MPAGLTAASIAASSDPTKPARETFDITPGHAGTLRADMRGIHANVGGEIVAEFIDDPAGVSRSVIVADASFYPYQLRRVVSATATFFGVA